MRDLVKEAKEAQEKAVKLALSRKRKDIDP